MMIRTQVYLPEELHVELKLLASSGRGNYSSLIREGVREVIKKKSKKIDKDAWKSFIGAGGKGKKTNAVRVFHDYYRSHAI